MRFANVFIRLTCSKFSLPKLSADPADGLSPRPVPGKSHEQTVCKLIASLVPINVRYNHFNRASLIKPRYKIFCFAFSLEATEQTCGHVGAFLLKPDSCLTPVVLFKQSGHKHTMNALFDCGCFRRKPRRFSSKSRKGCVGGRRRAVCIGIDNPTVKIKTFGNQSSIAKPETVASTKLAAHCGNFQLDFPIVMPRFLHTRPVNHFVLAEQLSRFTPLATEPMKQSVLIWLFGGEHAVLVPGAGDTIPAGVPQGCSLTGLSVSIKYLMDGGVHDTRIRFHGPPHCSLSFNTRWLEMPTGDLHEERRGANPTRSHERHREAPLREARRAAPDGARASAALSSIENSRFSRGTEPLRRKSYFFIVNPYSNTGTFSRIRAMPQPRIPNQSRLFGDVFCLHSFCFGAGSPIRRATDARDENLRAGVFPGGLRRVKEERKPRTVVSLTRRRRPYNQPGFHRALAAKRRMARQEKWAWLISSRVFDS